MSASGVRRGKAALSSGSRPTRRTLQPGATGAVMEVTKWLKPSGSVSRIGEPRLPLWVKPGSQRRSPECPKLGEEQTSISGGWRSAFSQKRSLRGRTIFVRNGIRLQLTFTLYIDLAEIAVAELITE